MLKVRIIPVLLLSGDRMVKGKQFDNYRDTGDPVSASKIYNTQYVDELVFLDINASNEGRSADVNIIKKVSKVCQMPFTIGGGVNSIASVRELLLAGADKVVINTAAINNPELIEQSSEKFGSQCIIVGIDVKLENGEYIVYSNSGKIKHESITLIDHIEMMEKAGAGEFFINAIHKDGMMDGYDSELIELVLKKSNIPVIFCGGAGNFQHLVEGYKTEGVDALAMSSIYHFGDNNPIRARMHLKNNKIPIKNV